MDAGWFVDPLGRFDGRFFDGESWTERVSDNGILKADPDWPLTKGPVGATKDTSVATQVLKGRDRRDGRDRRQRDIKTNFDRRSGQRRQLKALIVPD